MKTQTFGLELEFTGLNREEAAHTVANFFASTAEPFGGVYDTYQIKDNTGRTWTVMSDSSIRPECPTGCPFPNTYRVELVSPICRYEDIETLQRLVRTLRATGARVNRSCGIHLHIGLGEHTPKTLRNLANIVASKEDLIYQALGVDEAREWYCKKTNEAFLTRLNREKPDTLSGLADLWYEGYTGSRYDHYHPSRYHLVNYHSVFTQGTIEFRAFNATLQAGRIKAYIQFCLAISHQALTQRSASPRRTETTNPKYTFRTWLLRLGLIGDEFKSARGYLLANLEGDIAWRNGSAA